MTTQLSRVDGNLHLDTWTMMKEQAGMLVKTGFLPTAIKTPEQAVAIMLKGRELQIPSMYALSNIAVIQGKPVCNAELMLALIYRDHGDEAIRFPQSDHERCTIAYRRRSWSEPQTYSFTFEDAKRAGLAGSQTWQKYPAAMLRARCISAVARLAFPDSIGGMYTPEELGAAVTVNDEGSIEVLDVTPPPPVEIIGPPQQTINANLRRKAETTPDQAAAMFWDRFEGVLGSRDWTAVRRLLETDEEPEMIEPATVEGWREAWRAVDAALAQELDNAA
jgi:hypothetical protein